MTFITDMFGQYKFTLPKEFSYVPAYILRIIFVCWHSP